MYAIEDDGTIVVRPGTVLNYEASVDEDQRCSTLTVEARDRGIVGADLGDSLSGSLAAEVDVKVCISDVNEAPEFSGVGYRFMMPADMPPNKNVGVPVTAYDEDEGDGIYYSIKTEMPFGKYTWG